MQDPLDAIRISQLFPEAPKSDTLVGQKGKDGV